MSTATFWLLYESDDDVLEPIIDRVGVNLKLRRSVSCW